MAASRALYEEAACIFQGCLRATEQGLEGSPDDQWYKGARAATETLAKSLAKVFARDNESFSTERFLKACGVTE